MRTRNGEPSTHTCLSGATEDAIKVATFPETVRKGFFRCTANGEAFPELPERLPFPDIVLHGFASEGQEGFQKHLKSAKKGSSILRIHPELPVFLSGSSGHKVLTLMTQTYTSKNGATIFILSTFYSF